jgi:hypothetical protein
MLKYLPLIGWGGLIFGIITAIFAFMPGTLVLFSMFSMLPGFLLSSLYVMFTTRHNLETPKINPGYWGMALSSTPLILIIYFILTK